MLYLRRALDLEAQSSSLAASVDSESGWLVDNPSLQAGTVGLDLGVFVGANLDVERGPLDLLA